MAVHEFGHALGLQHTNVRGAIMYPYYTGYVPDMELHSDDIAGIQSLYGKRHKHIKSIEYASFFCSHKLSAIYFMHLFF